jgi:hypothetical protein
MLLQTQKGSFVMKEKGFFYTIKQNELVTRWQISQVWKKPFVCEPAPYVLKPHQEIVGPVRHALLDRKTIWPEDTPDLPCKDVFFPFEGEKVEQSVFCHEPTELLFAAQVQMEIPSTQTFRFRLGTCGGVKLFLDGVEYGTYSGYCRNRETSWEVSLHLEKGIHCLRILAHDLAERDTQYYFTLRYLSETPLSFFLPIQADMEAISQAHQILQGLYLKGFQYQRKSVPIFFSEPLKEHLTCTVRVAFSETHTESRYEERTFSLAAGCTHFDVGELLYREVGMVAVTVIIQSGDVTLSRTLDFEYFNGSLVDDCPSSIQERKRQALHFIAQHGGGTFQKALAMFCTGYETQKARWIVEKELEEINHRCDCSDFRTPALLAAYINKWMPEDLLEKIRHALLGFRYWIDEPGNDVMWFFSENHALCFHASEFLAGETFESELFSNSGMTGAQHREKAKQLLCDWFEKFYRLGYSEWNSAVYIPIDMISMFALYSLAKDAEIRQMAEKALDQTFEILARNSFHGVVAASYGRIYFKNLIGRRTSESTFLNYIASGQGVPNQHPFASTMFSLSDYVPPEQTLSLYSAPMEGMESVCHQGEDQALLYSYKTPDSIMGSVIGYRPGQPGYQEHVFQLMMGDCDTQVWINHPGESVYFGEGRPSYFAGNGTLPNVFQKHNHAWIHYSLLPQEVSFTHAYCPVDRFDRYLLYPYGIFLQKGKQYLALCAKGGVHLTDQGALKRCEIISPGTENDWEILIEPAQAYQDLEDFAESFQFSSPEVVQDI